MQKKQKQGDNWLKEIIISIYKELKEFVCFVRALIEKYSW